MTDTLQDLLARAIELEEKAAPLLEREFTPDAREDLEALADAPSAEAVAALSQRLATLHAQIDGALGVDQEKGFDEVLAAEGWDDFEAKADGDGEVEVEGEAEGEADGEVDEQGWADLDAESLATFDAALDDDDPAGMDFDEPDDEPAQEKADPLEDAWFDEEPETKALDDGGVLSEFELLRARRAELGI